MKNKKTFFRIILMLGVITLSAQTNLENYVKEGLENNIVLKQKRISLEKALYSLKTANSLFFPSVTLLADYTSGEGGRSISIPVGDMLNPVYNTLNQLTQSNRFPQIENVKQDFFPNQFYDVKLRASMPILNTDLIFNRQIQNGQIEIQEYEVATYRRELVKEIKTAYYNYLSALEAEKIYAAALELAKEGKRVNESLLKNGSGLPVYVLRSEAELENIYAKIEEAHNLSAKAGRYFNFLLNRDIEAVIITDSIDDPKLFTTTGENMWQMREELKMVQKGIEINKSALQMNKFHWVPKINGFVDFGAQDSKFKYNSDSRYTLYGIQLSLPIFEAFRSNYMIEQSELEIKYAELNLSMLNKQLYMSSEIAKGDLLTAWKNYSSALKQFETAKNYYRLITKGYKEGVNTFIETVDARSQYTQAELLVNINKYQIMIAGAKYERENPIQEIKH